MANITSQKASHLAPRIALVTGASRGIGYATALALAKHDTNTHIIATARTQGGLTELDDAIAQIGGSATLVEMDLADRAALPRLTQAIQKRWGRLDILVLNAGILGDLAPLAHLDHKTWDEVIDINLSACYRFIHALDNLFKQSPHGRAVLVSTAAVAAGLAYWGGYAVSKAGLEELGRQWAAELANTPHKVNMIRFGRVASAMQAQAFPGADLTALPQPADVAPAIVKLTAIDCRHNGQVLAASDLL